MTTYSGLDRRTGNDRRRQQLPLLRKIFYRGLRESSRRAEDRNRIVVMDRYKPSLIFFTIIVLSLSLLDAVLTLTLLAQGASELNPVMNYYLNHGPQVFLIVKYGLTALSVLIIVVGHEVLTNRYRFCYGILPLFASFFGCVVIWELYLLFI
jgi:hypothetical protein